jgi:hypothetical protein
VTLGVTSNKKLRSCVLQVALAVQEIVYGLHLQKIMANACRGILALILYYVIFMIAGDFAAYFLGLLVEIALHSN